MTEGRSLIAGKATEDGVELVCDCGTVTRLVFVTAARTPTPLEQAFTCDGCGSSHWFRIHSEEEKP